MSTRRRRPAAPTPTPTTPTAPCSPAPRATRATPTATTCRGARPAWRWPGAPPAASSTTATGRWSPGRWLAAPWPATPPGGCMSRTRPPAPPASTPPSAGRRVAVTTTSGPPPQTTTTVQYLHQDHLGSTGLVTTASGAFAQARFHAPFGAPWYTPTAAAAAVAPALGTRFGEPWPVAGLPAARARCHRSPLHGAALIREQPGVAVALPGPLVLAGVPGVFAGIQSTAPGSLWAASEPCRLVNRSSPC